MPHGLDDVDDALAEAQVFASIGTSGAVYPAAGFVIAARAYGAHTVEAQPRARCRLVALPRAPLRPRHRGRPEVGRRPAGLSRGRRLSRAPGRRPPWRFQGRGGGWGGRVAHAALPAARRAGSRRRGFRPGAAPGPDAGGRGP
ncbi:MAG: hypothetical protein R2734_04915 [Nocardioides sp.]